jgi:hypothetical protein
LVIDAGTSIPDLLAQGRGSSQIQGTVSLDDETDDNCTVLLPGMHRGLADWWELCSKRGAKPHTFVHRLTEQMYTKEDANRFGIHWTSVPCRRGQARVTLPHIPHGSHGPATGTRRTYITLVRGTTGRPVDVRGRRGRNVESTSGCAHESRWACLPIRAGKQIWRYPLSLPSSSRDRDSRCCVRCFGMSVALEFTSCREGPRYPPRLLLFAFMTDSISV